MSTSALLFLALEFLSFSNLIAFAQAVYEKNKWLSIFFGIFMVIGILGMLSFLLVLI